MAVEEEQRAVRLVLRGGGDFLLHGQVREEGLDFGRAHVLRVALVMKEDEALDPMDVGLLGARGVVLAANGLADLVEQLLGARFRGHFGRLMSDQERARIAATAVDG